MNCATAHELLLEAEPAELKGHADTELAHHLRTCARCRQRAQVILEQYSALRAALDRQEPRLDPADERWRRPIAAPAHHRRWPVIVPVALAASVAVLLLGRHRGLPAPAATSLPQIASSDEALDVQGPPGRTVAVFRTDNPNIVVIWSF